MSELKVDDVIEVRDGERWRPAVVTRLDDGDNQEGAFIEPPMGSWRVPFVSYADEGKRWRRRPTYEQGRADERAAVVTYLHSIGDEMLADAIARGEHEREG